MSEYDYLNARVRGMSRHLLDRETFEDLLQAGGEDVLMDVLLESSYGEELRSELGRGHGLDVVEDALRRSLSKSVHHVLSLAPEEPARLLALQLNRWDVQNIVTILRGVLRASTGDEIMASMVPAGQFRVAQLAELAAETEVTDVADALTTWNYRFAYPIRQAIREQARGRDHAQMETQLMSTYFQWALSQLSHDDENEAILRRHLRMQVDLINIVGSLHIVSDRDRKGGPRESERMERLPGGFLGGAVLDEIEEQPNVAMAPSP